ncbi:hypothetical protein ACTOB_004786 [Actinoplanes oblitus]|uniref:Maltokinase n=1 Tax=Actinoplanes oblitus TaxID=3040509 RepID=A0ABY8W560_9ACTN|nr:hypothetical protein [Actinoplanes oblitus]WIM92828.1 hypothetical protein ACTOB_004786 [Actinoplanes oblitus]
MIPDLNAPPVLAALTGWLQRQPWCPAGHRGRARVVSAPVLVNRLPAGGPAAVLAVVGAGPVSGWCLVPLGIRPGPPPVAADHVVRDLDHGCVYDATQDEELMRLVLSVFAGAAAPVASGRPSCAVVDAPRPGTGGPACTPVLVDDTYVLKWYRHVPGGGHPGLELHRALHALGNGHVSALHGSLETDVRGSAVTFAALQAAPAGHGALEAAVRSARAVIAGEEPETGFMMTARGLGTCVARVHADLLAAFRGARLSSLDLRRIANDMIRQAHDVPAAVPELQPYRSRLLAALAEVADVAAGREPVVAQRVHSDLRLDNILLTGQGAVVDFDWVRTAPEQRSRQPVARDVAGVLRSLEWTARDQLARAATPGDAAAGQRAGAWVARCRQAFLTGYADAGGRVDERVLRAYEIDCAVRELVHRAEPAPADVAAICRMLTGPSLRPALPGRGGNTRSRRSRRTGPADCQAAPDNQFSAVR